MLSQGGSRLHNGLSVQGSAQEKGGTPWHRRLRTMAGALIRELERKLPEAVREEQSENFTLCRRVLAQKPHDTDKIYSLHEPPRLLRGQRQGAQEIRIWNQSLCGDDQDPRRKNLYDAHALPEVLDQPRPFTDIRARRAIVDRAYRGRKCVAPRFWCPEERPDS